MATKSCTDHEAQITVADISVQDGKSDHARGEAMIEENIEVHVTRRQIDAHGKPVVAANLDPVRAFPF